MKPKSTFTRFIRSLLLGTAVATAAGTVSAQNIDVKFDNDSIWAQTNQTSLATWQWWGGCATTREWTTNDASGNPNSGSVKISITWPDTPGSSDFQYSVGMPLSGVGNYDLGITVNPLSYTNFEFDLLWDTNSTATVDEHMASTITPTNTTPGGDPNYFGFGFVATQYGQTWVPGPNQPVLTNSGQWVHYSIPINPAWPVIPGVIFKKWRPNTGEGATNLVGKVSSFYVDNLRFNYNTNTTTPKPTLAVKPATKGLNLIAALSGNQYQRASVRSVPADPIKWYGNPNPVTYSLTIGEIPSGATYGGFQVHIYLAPDGTGNGPDWDNPNVIMLQFQENANGSGVCNFRYKTNTPAANGNLYGSGTIAQLAATTVKGTWSATFTNNSYVTIVGPGGVSTNFNMGAEVAAFFDTATPSMATYYGIVPNQPNNISQRAVITRARITDGATTVVDDTFSVPDPTQESDPALWINMLDGNSLNSIKVVDQDGYWVDWNKPDGFLSSFEVSSNVITGWVDAGLPVRDHGLRRAVFAGTNLLMNYPNAAYFRLTSTNAP